MNVQMCRFSLLRFAVSAVVLGSFMASADSAELTHSLFQAIKSRNDAQVVRMLRQGTPANFCDAQGRTPLMVAALHGTHETFRLLLEAGANPNAANKNGATPLLWSVTDAKKVDMLLAHGADVNAKNDFAVTPLFVAAGVPNRSDVVRMLLSHGADISARASFGDSVLKRAIKLSDLSIVETLFQHAEANGQLSLLIGDDPADLLNAAAGRRNLEMLQLVCDQLTRHNGGMLPKSDKALISALRGQSPVAALELLERGVDVDDSFESSSSPLLLFTAYSDIEHVGVFDELMKRGVDVTMENEKGENALTWARKRGHSKLIEALAKAGVPDKSDEPLVEIPERDVNLHAGNEQALLREAITKGIATLQHSSDVFLKERKCTSCHQNDIPAIAAGWARDRGLQVDHESLDKLIRRQTEDEQIHWRNRLSYVLAQTPGMNARSIGYRLWEYSSIGYPADSHTEAMVWFVATTQRSDGRWVDSLSRPPITGGDFIATSLAIQSLQLYPLTGRGKETRERISRAANWLGENEAKLQQEKAFKLLGLAWAGKSTEELQPLVHELFGLQNDDGGWSQLTNLSSDALATGQALVALRVAGGIPTSHADYQRGMRFLLNTQFDDGSWYVQSRSNPIQKYFESGFPFGHDQWISAPATAWASMALTLAVAPTSTQLPATLGAPLSDEANDEDDQNVDIVESDTTTENADKTASSAVKTVSFVRDVQPILERSCVGCHRGDKAQGSLVMTDLESLLRGGDSGSPAIAPGKSSESLMVNAASRNSDGLVMPPEEELVRFPALSKAEIGALRQWIDAGAAWPKGVKLQSTGY